MLQSSRPRCEKSRLNRTVLRHVIAPSCLVEFGAFIFDMRVSATVRQEWEGLCTFYFTVWFVHVLFYRVVRPGLAEIVRVLHERMEPSRHFGAQPEE